MRRILLLALVASFIFWGCNNDDSSSNVGILSVRLSDSPADYEAVLIDVMELHINVSTDESDESGWQMLSLDTVGQIDLLQLTNGKDILLAEENLGVGNIGQMRLVLGPNNKILVDGAWHDLETPSGQQSGLKFNIHATIEAGVPYKMWIDFDVAKSIVEKGNGTYSLKPTIKVFTEESGAISGVVIPVSENPLIMAVMGQDTSSTFADTLTGEFVLMGLDAGMYEVEFDPGSESLYDEKEVEDVNVTTGQVTDIDTVKLMMKQF